MNTITVHFELNNKVRPDKRHDILIRFSENRKLKRISTKMYVHRVDFNSSAKHGAWIRPSDPFSSQKNFGLKDLLFKAETAQRELEKAGIRPTIENVVAHLRGTDDSKNSSFIAYFEKVIEQLKAKCQVNTFYKYRTSVKMLKKYLGNREFKFIDFNTTFLMEYETHLKSQNKKPNTINKELKVLRAVLYRAIKEELVSFNKNPFFGFVLKTGKTNKTKLTKAEIEKIEKLQLDESHPLWHTRNYFLFSYYVCGIRFADFAELRWRNIVNGRVEYQMGKTDEYKSVCLHERPIKILEHYEKCKADENDFIFPLLDKRLKYNDPFFLKNQIGSKNSIVNKNLKSLAELAEINKKISFHIARHSYADVARTQGMNIYSISKSLGHSTIGITEKYLNSFDQESVDREIMDKVFIK